MLESFRAEPYKQEVFRQKLQILYPNLEEKALKWLTLAHGVTGVVGVMEDNSIHLKPLWPLS